MTGWELRIWRKSMLWSREKAAREFGVPHMQGMRKADIIRRLENELGETAGNV